MSNLTLTTRHLSRTIRLHVGTFWLLCILSSLLIRTAESVNQHGAVDVENNEFAEFEDMDEPTVGAPSGGAGGGAKKQAEGGAPADSGPPASKPPSHDDAAVDDDEDVAEAVVEDDSDEFAHLQDEDEFENFDKERVENPEKDSAKRPSDQAQPLKFADVPAHFRSNWTNYQVELLVLAGLVVYLLNYVYGKTKNQTLAYTWFEEHRELLEQQFAVVGDDGSAHGTQPTTSHLIKETDSSFSIWCSGRAGCQGMLIQLKLLKRQDLVSVISQIIRPKYDRIVVRVELDNNEMDSFVFAVGQRKCLIKLVKDMTDLSLYTSEKKNADKLGLPASFTIFSEIAEATTSMIDPRVTQMINKYEDSIEYIHFSDQYSGPKPQEGETQTRLPEAASVLVFSFNIPGKMSASERHIEHVKPLINMVFYCLDKARRYRLSREGKAKADKNRQAAQEAFLKTTHLQRQEAAQARREEKTRERKQRLMEEEDPDRQRRLEKIEQKRDAKLKQPKMKQLKVKQ